MSEQLILLIDDKKANLLQLESLIKEIGFKQILIANCADDGWGAMKRQKVDCVIAAYDMQEMSGIALLKIIRKEESLSEIPFFLTDQAFTKIKVIKAGQGG